MGRNAVTDKIVSFTVQLRTSQVTWIKSNPDIKVNKFFRDQLNKFIELKEKIQSI